MEPTKEQIAAAGFCHLCWSDDTSLKLLLHGRVQGNLAMTKTNEGNRVVAPPAGGGWADYIEAQLDMRERTERLRALRLQHQGEDGDDGADQDDDG